MPEVMISRMEKKYLIHEINKSGLITQLLGKFIFSNDDDEPILDTNSAQVPTLLIGSACCKADKIVS